MRYLSVFLVALLLSSCGEKGKHIPLATGLVGDLYVVMDSAQRKGTIGHLVDSIFQAEMPGLPREEPIFRIHWVDARRYNYVLKERRNIIFVMTLDQRTDGAAIVRRMYTQESLESIRNNPDDFFSTRSDVNARSQEMAFIYGPDELTLARNLRSKGSQMATYFNLKERQRQTQALFKAGQVKGITDILIRDFSCALKVPFGYKFAYQQPDFFWIRQINPRDDKNIFISRKPYRSLDDFSLANLIAFRNDVCRQHIFADPDDSESYLMTETTVPYIPVTADTVNFNGRFAIQLRGLFRSHTPGVGGPFIGFAVVDEEKQLFYYIEGFTISPGREQREIMRELETILYTFQTSKELPVQELKAP
jgi:hypothetical protein